MQVRSVQEDTMKLSPKIGIHAKQSIAINSQIIQSIRVLQYGNAELEEFLMEQAERNPLIEVMRGCDASAVTEEREYAGDDVSPKSADETSIQSTERSADIVEKSHPEAHFKHDIYGQRRISGDLSNAPARSFEEFTASTVSLREHLITQAAMTFRNPADYLIANELIGSLEPDGYLRRDLEEMADRLGVGLQQVSAVLQDVQRFDPSGVAARDLAECLTLQLQEKNRLDPPMKALLANLQLLANFDLKHLARLCGVDLEDIRDMVREIRELDPRPGLRFDNDSTLPALPDVLVTPGRDDSYIVELNPALLPRVLIDRQYESRIEAGSMGQQDKHFVMECMRNANWLIKNLDQRAKTILKVATEIVSRQTNFFRFGAEQLVPLSLKDVAVAVSVHESTVCRAISGKYIMTNRGMFEMKYFFSNAIASVDGGEDLSAEMVRHKISSIVNTETIRNIMSDEAIMLELRRDGIDVARRTIAKYRDMMNIPSSAQRRRQKRAAGSECSGSGNVSRRLTMADAIQI